MAFQKTPVVVRAHAYGQPFWSQYRRMVKDIGRESVYLLWDFLAILAKLNRLIGLQDGFFL